VTTGTHHAMKTTALLLCLLSLAACAAPTQQTAVTTAPTAGFVTDLPRFEQFIATAPTPEQFRAQYPDVTLVLPGSIATKEMRLNKSRYFAQLDGNGRITGGQFQ